MPQTIYDVIDRIVAKDEHQGSDVKLARLLCRRGLHHPREIVTALLKLGCSEADIKSGMKQARIISPDVYFQKADSGNVKESAVK